MLEAKPSAWNSFASFVTIIAILVAGAVLTAMILRLFRCTFTLPAQLRRYLLARTERFARYLRAGNRRHQPVHDDGARPQFGYVGWDAGLHDQRRPHGAQRHRHAASAPAVLTARTGARAQANARIDARVQAERAVRQQQAATETRNQAT